MVSCDPGAKENAWVNSDYPDTVFGLTEQLPVAYKSGTPSTNKYAYFTFDIGQYNAADYNKLILHLMVADVLDGESETGWLNIHVCMSDALLEEYLTWRNKPDMVYVLGADIYLTAGYFETYDLLPFINKLIANRSGGNITLVITITTDNHSFKVNGRTAPVPESDKVWLECDHGEVPERTPLEQIGDWFAAIDFPILGAYVFAPLAAMFYAVQDNLDTITGSISGFLTATGITDLISATFDIVNHTWYDVTYSISSAVGLVVGMINDLREDIPIIIDAHISLLPDIIQHTWNDVTTQISLAINNLSNIVDHTWEEVLNLIPTWTDLVPYGFPKSVTELTTLIETYITEIPTWLPTTLTAFNTLVLNTVTSAWDLFGKTAAQIVEQGKTTILGWFPYDITNAQSLLTWIGIEAGDVITTILDTPADMFAWIRTEMENQYSILTDSWSDITQALIVTDMLNYIANNPQWQDTKANFFMIGSSTWDLFGKTASELATAITPYIPTLPEWLPTSLTDFEVLIQSIVPPLPLDFPKSITDLIAFIQTYAPAAPDWLPTSLTDFENLITGLIPPWPEGFPTTTSEIINLIMLYAPAAPDWLPTSLTDFENLVTAIVPPVPTWLPLTLTSFTQLIVDTVTGAWDLFGKTAAQIVTKGKDTILGWFPYDITNAQSLLTWIGIEAGDVITTILDTPADMFAWIRPEIEAKYSIIMHTWDEIVLLIPTWTDIIPEGFPVSLTALITLIEEYAGVLPTWLSSTLEGFKEDVITWVAEGFDIILDIVFKEE